MGHCCDECGQKLVGGLVAKSCECSECFCSKCWKNLFKGEYALSTKTYYYYNDDGKLVKEDEDLYTTQSNSGYCKRCKKSYGGIDNFTHY